MTGYRISRGGLAVAVRGELIALRDPARLDVQRLSPAALTFVVPPSLAGRPLTGAPLEVQLEGGADRLRAVVADERDEGAGARLVTARLDGLALEEGREIARLLDRLLARRIASGAPEVLVQEELVTDPQRIEEIVYALFA